ncbi:uncharacterized protein LOC132791011 [Drosophila nasuta]|uniref:uncharacterized protein LOC132791011 n=1 Tax=Drosophila nasuta TaxID=42062 RepID=UPI00295EB1D2|nr:uncharacterized protein LOC132791011 [Drosophila nasuta]
MRLSLLLLIVALSVVYSYSHPVNEENVQEDKVNTLLNLADQGEAHANAGTREARGFGGGGGYCCGGGYGRGGYGGYGGYGRGGYGGYGRGGYGRGGYGGYGRGGYGKYGR